MALTINKCITISGQSIVGGTPAVYMQAIVNTEANTMQTPSITSTITDMATYTTNKSECRKDIASFTEKVYEVQDEVLVESSKIIDGGTN